MVIVYSLKKKKKKTVYKQGKHVRLSHEKWTETLEEQNQCNCSIAATLFTKIIYQQLRLVHDQNLRHVTCKTLQPSKGFKQSRASGSPIGASYPPS